MSVILKNRIHAVLLRRMSHLDPAQMNKLLEEIWGLFTVHKLSVDIGSSVPERIYVSRDETKEMVQERIHHIISDMIAVHLRDHDPVPIEIERVIDNDSIRFSAQYYIVSLSPSITDFP